mgnify:CR=1 FL=1
MNNPFTLQGKVILVTGASSGIGRAVAIECSRMGAKVIITARNSSRLEETFSQLEGKGHSLFTADISKPDVIENMIPNLPSLDGITHCAGIIKNIPFVYASPENIEEVMKINFYAPAEITRMSIKAKKLKRDSSVVFISSVSGVFCSAIASSVYSASKGAINGLLKGMALDLAPKGIRVNSINPGVVETHIFDADVISREQLEEDKKRYPLKRFGKPEEIAYAAVYLLSDASAWITGTNLLIDGGYTLL